MRSGKQKHPSRRLLLPAGILLLATFVFAVNPTYAASPAGGFSADTSKSGFSGPGEPSGISTIAKALKMRDESRVSLKGSIVRQIGSEEYEFKDNTGTIILDIDDDVWWGQTITPKDVVIVNGEVDRDLDEFQNKIEIEVDRIVKQ